MMIPLIEDDCEIKEEVPKEFFSPQRHPPPQRLRRGRRDHRGFCFGPAEGGIDCFRLPVSARHA